MVHRITHVPLNRHPAYPLELAPFLHTGRSRNRATGAPANHAACPTTT